MFAITKPISKRILSTSWFIFMRIKVLGIGNTFEKENIDSLDAKVEVLLTILSSLTQDESRSK